MMSTCIQSARDNNVKEDFHIWTNKDIPSAIVHPCGNFNKNNYLFKFHFLYNEVKKLDYDYFVFLDADNFFIRHPGEGTYDNLLRDNKLFVQMENEVNSHSKRGDWWGIPIHFFPQTLRYKGVVSKKIYNTNAGFWIVRKEFIDEFYEKAMDFWNYCYHDLDIKTITEEAPLAFMGHLYQKDIQQSTFQNTSQIWASDWTGNFSTKFPCGKEWEFEDYMTGDKSKVNPSIVHMMRGKELLIKGIEKKEDNSFRMPKNIIDFPKIKTGTEQNIIFTACSDNIFTEQFIPFYASLKTNTNFSGGLSVINYGITGKHLDFITKNNINLINPKKQYEIVSDRFISVVDYINSIKNNNALYCHFDCDVWFNKDIEVIFTECRKNKKALCSKDVWHCGFLHDCISEEKHKEYNKNILLNIEETAGKVLQAGFIIGDCNFWNIYSNYLLKLLENKYIKNVYGSDALTLNLLYYYNPEVISVSKIGYNVLPQWDIKNINGKLLATDFHTDSKLSKIDNYREEVYAIHFSGGARNKKEYEHVDFKILHKDIYDKYLKQL